MLKQKIYNQSYSWNLKIIPLFCHMSIYTNVSLYRKWPYQEVTPNKRPILFQNHVKSSCFFCHIPPLFLYILYLYCCTCCHLEQVWYNYCLMLWNKTKHQSLTYFPIKCHFIINSHKFSASPQAITVLNQKEINCKLKKTIQQIGLLETSGNQHINCTVKPALVTSFIKQ